MKKNKKESRGCLEMAGYRILARQEFNVFVGIDLAADKKDVTKDIYIDSKHVANLKVGEIADEIMANLCGKFSTVEYEGCRSMVYDTIIKYLK